MTIDLIINGQVYYSKPYIGRDKPCPECALNEICAGIDHNDWPCKNYPAANVMFIRGNNEQPLYNPSVTALMAKPINNTDFSVRVCNICQIAGIETIGELLSYGRDNFRKIRHAGGSALVEVWDFLESHGIMWPKEPQPLNPEHDENN